MVKLTVTSERDFELIGKIKNLKFLTIMRMSYPSLARLTDDFREVLVNNLLYRGETNGKQSGILEKIKKAYEYTQPGWPFPDYMQDLQMNLEIGQLLTPKGFISLSPLEEEEEEAPQTSDSTDDMKAELEMLREQVKQFRNKEKGTALGLNQPQAALFGLALANTFGFKYTNKKKDLAPMLHKLFGWGESKLATCLSEPCDKEERDELANLFKDLYPPLYATIMNRGELPPKVTPEVTP